VLHSTTKFIEGHNATVGGVLITRNAELHERFDYVRKSTGTIQAPFDAWLTLQGAKTLPLRIRQHSENALEIAKFLEGTSANRTRDLPGPRVVSAVRAN
jgi:cystathionine beta-lyase/cystathionine gamma-synthase